MQLVTYDHIQSNPSTTWTITHNLGCKPVMDALASIDGGPYQKVFPTSVVHVNDNTMEVTFSVARVGKARLVGNTTDILRSPVDSYFDHDN